jgi:hypothetical protein
VVANNPVAADEAAPADRFQSDRRERGIARLSARAETVAEIAEDLAMVARLARDLPGWLRAPMTPEQSHSEVQTALRTRELRLLWLAEHAIYAQPRSPYRALLAHAGCELGDLRRLVQQDGVEGALRALAERGVYVTDDELKGRRPIVRGSLRITPSFAQFRNPIEKPHFMVLTGGSTGRAARAPRSLGSFGTLALSQVLHHQAHGVTGYPPAFWSMNPAPLHLAWARIGNPLRYWLLPLSPLPLQARVGAQILAGLSRLGGAPLPPATPCEISEPETMARVIGGALRRHGRLLVNCATSAAVRAAIAARERGLSLDGVVFDVRSEPLTIARRRDVEAAGARVISSYGSTELTWIAGACGDRSALDDLHLAAYEYALVTRPREAGPGDERLDGLLVSTLAPTAPVIGLNTEMGDVATVEERAGDCCLLGSLGLSTHLSNVRSFDKLTGEGVTVARSDMLRVLEDVLPGQFGGTSIDYQLAEEIGPDGLIRLILRVAPRVGPVGESALRATLLAGLDRGGVVDQHMAALWRQAGTVVVRREEPLATAAGKVLPFYRDRRSQHRA